MGGRKTALLFTLALGFADLSVINFILAPRLERHRQVAAPFFPEARRPAVAEPRESAAAPDAVVARSAPAVAEVTPQPSPPPSPAVASLAPEHETSKPTEVPTPVPSPTASSATEPAAQEPVGAVAATQLPPLPVILFPTGSDVLTATAKAELEQVAAEARAHARAHLHLRGHTDERGDHSYNVRLSLWRAMSAMRYLIRLGVPRSQLSVEGVGSQEPVAVGGDIDAWAKNRRVQIVWRSGGPSGRVR